MIDELYDSVLSVTNEVGYLDKISEVEDKKSLLRWSSNNLFKHNRNKKIYTPKYPVKFFSHDEWFINPVSYVIKKDDKGGFIIDIS